MENKKDFFFDNNLINDVIDGLVDEKTAAEFFEHIKECPDCQKKYEETIKLREIMKQDGFLPGTENMPGEDFAEKTMMKIRAAKKPIIIRIINHPAAKAALAAVACLLIAVFVFRSDLFGKLEGANGIADEMIATEEKRSALSSENRNNANSDEINEYDSVEYPATDAEAEAGYDSSETTPAMAPDLSAMGYNDNGYENSETELPYSEEEPAEEAVFDVTEESAPIDIFSIEPEEPAAEEACSEYEPVPPTPAQADNNGIEMPADEAECYIEPVTTTEPASAPEPEEEVTDTAEEAEPGANQSTFKSASSAPMPPAVYELTATEKDAETAKEIAKTLAKENYEKQAYSKLVLVFPNRDEVISPETMSLADTDIIFVGETEYDGNIYSAYEIMIYNGRDTVAERFGSEAMEIFPDIVSEYENKELLLVIFKTNG